MRGPQPPEITLTVKLHSALEKITRCYTNPYWLVLRAKIVLYAAQGDNNTAIGRQLDTTQHTAAKWRKRWLELAAQLLVAETAGCNDGNGFGRRMRYFWGIRSVCKLTGVPGVGECNISAISGGLPACHRGRTGNNSPPA